MADKYFAALSYFACALGCFCLWWSARKVKQATKHLAEANDVYDATIIEQRRTLALLRAASQRQSPARDTKT